LFVLSQPAWLSQILQLASTFFNKTQKVLYQHIRTRLTNKICAKTFFILVVAKKCATIVVFSKLLKAAYLLIIACNIFLFSGTIAAQYRTIVN